MWGDFSMMQWGGWGSLGMLPMLLWWALILLAIVVLVRWLIAGDRDAGGRARDALAQRYARGEIGKDEFDRIKKDLAP